MRSCILTLLTLIAFSVSSFKPGSVLVITSSAFSNNGFIPAKYSCEGSEVSPPLQISNIPTAAKSLALIVHDPDAPKEGGVTHWVVYNMDINGYVPEAFKNADQGLNSEGKKGYLGMCPPSGTHHYFFRVYALDKKVDLLDKPSAGRDELEKEMQGHILAQGELVGLYKKTK